MAGIITSDTEYFIESVEKRPALYLKSLKEYSDIHKKKKLWEEVCLEVVNDWAELDAEKMRKIGADVQKKWLNLRTCFSRELKAQKTKSGKAASKRRKYIYFEKLLFLKSSLAQRPTESNILSSDPEEEDDLTESIEETASQLPRSAKQPTQKQKKNTNVDFQELLLNILQEDLNEDKNFALSLVPTLKSLTEDEKFEAKIEILQIFQRIKGNRRVSFR